MRRLLIFGLAVMLLSLSSHGTTLFAQQDGQAVSQIARVLQVVDSEPLGGQELALSGDVTLYFDHRLDCDTVPDAFSITPSVTGDLTCDGTSLTFSPDSELERAQTYTLRLGTSLRGADGAQLLEAYELELNTVGFVRVSETFPTQGAGEVVTDTAITLIFNRPVVPLVTSANADDLVNPLQITPETPGTGEWVNTSIYQFTPDSELAGGTDYEVTVSAGLESVDGAVLPEDYTLTFSTELPRITERVSEPGDGVELDRRIQMRFNQPMDRTSVEDAFELHPMDNPEQQVSGSFEWADDNQGFMFQPDNLLQPGTDYLAGVEFGEAETIYGSPVREEGVKWSFTTVPLPQVVDTDPNNGQQNASLYGVGIQFASPMNIDTIEDRLTIEPEPSLEPNTFYSDYSYHYRVSFFMEPSTTYTVTLAAGAEDIYGNAIQEPYTFSFTTEGYQPQLNLNVPGYIGFYNAERDPTQLYINYRNIDAIDLQLYEISSAMLRSAILSNEFTLSDEVMTGQTGRLLREWTIDRDVPQNALRYDLLSFTEGGAADDSCPQALASRLSVGDSAIVITEPDPLRARSSAPNGDIVELLYRDYALTVVGGPVCENGLRWWEVELRDERTAWVAESLDAEYLIAPTNGGVAEVELSADGENGLDPGFYYLTLDASELRSIQEHILIVGNANLMMKQSLDEVTVWATDVQTGQPIPDSLVSVYQGENTFDEPVATAVTDANGVARLDVPPIDDLYTTRMAFLNSNTHRGVGMSGWSNGIEPYNFGQSFDFYPSDYRIYVHTDRPVYRPGQPVYFRGVVRLKEDVSYTPPDDDFIPVEIFDDSGQSVYEQRLELTEYGTFSGEFTLSEDAGLGNYRLEAVADSGNPNEYFSVERGTINFSVAEYRLPEFQVEMTPLQSDVVQGETVRVNVDSTYFFGGAVSDASVSYSIRSSSYNFNYQGDGFYDFINDNPDAGPGEFYDSDFNGQIADATATTDDSGELVIEVPADIAEARRSQQFSVEAVVRDETNQAVAARTSVTVHKGLLYVGVRPESYVSTAEEETNLEMIAVDWDSNGIGNQSLDVDIVERRWSSVQEQDSNGRTTWTYEVEEIPVDSGSVTTGSEGEATYTFTPPRGGVYKVTVTTRDERGNEVVTSTNIWVSSGQYVSWRQQNSNRIDLVADRDEYSVGDTAEILITSPFQGTTEALITVERGRVLSVERVTMDSNSYIYELPVTADHAPNIFVSALLIRGVDENNPVAGFRMGYIQLGVDVSQKVLDIDIAANTDRAQPQEVVTYTVRTTDYAGNPVQSEMGISVTDLASLSLAPDNSRPILNYYYGDQSLSVRTSTPLTIYTDQLTQETLDTVKGGGGGGGSGGLDGLIEIRGEFVDTPYWNGALETDANGEATFDVRLPDNLTTWRLDARAITLATDGNMLVGQETFDLLSTRPLIVRPVTPRFFVVGDEVVLSAVVNNNTEAEQQVVVTLEQSGFTLSSDSAQVITVPADGRARVSWDVVVNDVSQVNAVFTADAGNFTDGSISPVSIDDEGNLPVYRYDVPETVGTAGTLTTAESRVESIVLPRRFDVTQGELVVSVDKSLAVTTLDGLDYLENYPHQCIEQTVSRFLPNIITYRALNQLGVADATLEDNLQNAVGTGIQKLLAEQKSSGGWGWFVGDDGDPLTTAYALIGLYEAQQQGYDPSPQVISRAQDFVRSNLQSLTMDSNTWQLNRQAFMLYALARTGAPDVARTSNLYELRDGLSRYAKAYLALTLHAIDATDLTRKDTLIDDILSDAIVNAAGIHWKEDRRDFRNWNTDLRTTAIVLEALVTLRPESELIPNVVRYLMVQRTAEAWETTQETAWSVMALTDWMVISGELSPDYSYTVTLNDETLTSGTAVPGSVRESDTLRVQVADLLQDEANDLVFNRTGSDDGALYYTAYLEAYVPVTDVEPLDRGITIQRSYTLPGSDTPITEARAGEVVEVHLTIVAPSDLNYVVVEDPLPAGAEAINPDLETSQQVGTRPGLDNSNPLRYGWGWWYFSEIEFRDEKVNLYSTYLPAGTYEYRYTMRLSVEGTYNVIPPTVQEFYFPDVYGRGAGSSFTVLPAAQ